MFAVRSACLTVWVAGTSIYARLLYNAFLRVYYDWHFPTPHTKSQPEKHQIVRRLVRAGAMPSKARVCVPNEMRHYPSRGRDIQNATRIRSC